MQKRAAIARAMALDPMILFLDEPSAGLDPITSAELDALITRLARNLGATFVVVTHELPSIFAIADRVIMLDRTRKGIVAEGDPRTLRDTSADPWVRRFFNREAEPAAATA
jgi:phospholipid/cholesterol/gamma-HCH transport system ATP-binding protein